MLRISSLCAAGVVAVLPFSISPAFAQTSSANPGIDMVGMDTSVTPCQDFNAYANGKWLTNTPIPADQTYWGNFPLVNERNQAILHTLLEQSAKDAPTATAGSVAQKVGDFYAVALDQAKANALGAKPLTAEIARINAIQTSDDLLDELAHLHQMGVDVAFGFDISADAKNSDLNIAEVGQGGLGLPERDYYFKDDAKSQADRAAYLSYIGQLLTLTGDAPEVAARNAAATFALEKRLARVSLTNVQLRDPQQSYHKMTLAEVQAGAPGVSWKRYFTAVGLPEPGGLNNGMPAFMTEAALMLGGETPLDDWKAYLRFHLASAAAGFLSDDFYAAKFNFYNKTLYGQQQQRPRWKRAAGATDGALGEAVGQLYVAQTFPPEAKARMLALIGNLKAALHDRIQEIDWMSAPTKEQALLKLSKLTVKVGYPDKWRDYSKLSIDRNVSFAENVMRANVFEWNRQLAKAGKPVDKTEWGMTPPTVNAYYNPQNNEIVFPAGILQPPFFNKDADDVVNYGAIGAIIGHEMTHGFDDSGRQFDANGNLRDWWTKEDTANFTKRSQAIIAQYSQFELAPGLKNNGQLTAGEAIADIGGLKIAYLAYQKSLQGKPHPAPIAGFTVEQRFFIAFAQAFRGKLRTEAERSLALTDPHPPDRFRINGATADTPEFAQAFHCPAGEQKSAPSVW